MFADKANTDITPNELAIEKFLLPSNEVTTFSNRYQIAATSDNTRRAYQSDIRHF